MKTAFLAGLALIGALAIAGATNAQSYGYHDYGYSYANTYDGETLPYFSLHPPVYYSYRVPRPYGYSPFAYPPGYLTPGSEQAPSRHLAVPSAYDGGANDQGDAHYQPLRIDNPYVDQSNRSGVTKRPPTQRKPQIVYPAALVKASH